MTDAIVTSAWRYDGAVELNWNTRCSQKIGVHIYLKHNQIFGNMSNNISKKKIVFFMKGEYFINLINCQ